MNRLMLILIKRPIPIIVLIMDDPPELKNTRGIPTTGRRPMVILIFITSCQNTMEIKPTERIDPNISFEFLAILRPHRIRIR